MGAGIVLGLQISSIFEPFQAQAISHLPWGSGSVR